MVSLETTPGVPQVAPGRMDGHGMLRARATVPDVSRTIRRRWLDERFDAAARHRLTLVSAGPGWGKTTAAALWARRRRGVAWLTLEPRDDGPSTFWREVLVALRLGGVVPAGHPLDELRVPARVTPAFLRRLYRGVELLPEPSVLVLDDVHLITDESVLSGLVDLMRFPAPVRFVLATRIDPVLPLHRLRAEGELAEIVADDLAFGASDVLAMSTAEGNPLAPDSAQRLVQETGGWPVGVRLRLHGEGGALADPSASASEYLLAEVLERQDPVLRDLLLRTSVTPAVCADLATALVEGGVSGADFARLVTNDFVTATGDSGWYRYHPLLRDMLRGQLRIEDPAGFADAHARAARWMVRNGEPRQALEHAMTAGRWELFGEVFVDAAGGGLVESEREGIVDLLRRVPYADLRPSAQLELCAAAEAVVSGRFEAARGHVAEARALLSAAPRASTAALLAIVESTASRGVGDVDAVVRAAREAVEAVELAPWPYPALSSYTALALNNLGVGRMLRGETTPAHDVLADLARTAADQAPSLAVLNARTFRAFGLVHGGAVEEGDRDARAALDDAARWGWASHLQARMAFAATGWVRLLRAEEDEADRLAAQGLAADVGGAEPSSTLALRLLQTFVAVSRGRSHAAVLALDAAREVAARAGAPALLRDQVVRAVTEVQLLTATPYHWLRARPESGELAVAQVARARVLVATGRAEAALPITRDVVRHGAAELDPLARTEALLAHASALAHLSRTGVDDALAEALVVAGPDRLARPFLAVRDPALTDRLGRLVALRPGELAALVRDRLGHHAPVGPEPEPLVEPLTERELAMLAALPTMESNAEIAADFYVSVNTVKAHLKALYRKLGVGSRREAVRRGRDLGLLD